MDETGTQTDPAPATPNKYASYQLLMESRHDCVYGDEKKTYNINISELLRDLYIKLYTLQNTVDKLTKSLPNKE